MPEEWTLDVDVAWTEDAPLVLAQQVLLQLAADVNDGIEIAHAIGSGPEEVGQAIVHLENAGLAGTPRAKMGERHPQRAAPSARGRALVSAWDAKRTPGQIEEACRAAMLAWLYANRGQIVASTFDLATNVRGHYYGERFDDNALKETGRILLRQNLISGTGTAQGPILHPAITLDGQVVHTQHGGDLLAWRSAGSTGATTYNISNSTGVNLAHQSPGATQSVVVNAATLADVRTLAGALDRLRSEIDWDPLAYAQAAGIAQQLEAAANAPTPDRSRLRELVAAARDVGVNATGGAAGAGLVALAEHILHRL